VSLNCAANGVTPKTRFWCGGADEKQGLGVAIYFVFPAAVFVARRTF
jgi:hypothetical protein